MDVARIAQHANLDRKAECIVQSAVKGTDVGLWKNEPNHRRMRPHQTRLHQSEAQRPQLEQLESMCRQHRQDT